MLQYNPKAAVAALAAADEQLAELIERVGPFEIEERDVSSTFEALLRSIVYQQLSGKAAATIYGRVRVLYPEQNALLPEQLLVTADEVLRSAGLSRAKTAAVKDLAAKTLDGTVPSLEQLSTMTDAEIIERLIQVRGIGVWTVEMLLLFSLGRPDVLPINDLGVRKGFMLTYGLEDLPKPAELLEHGERWRPYRSVASWYFWRAVDSQNPLGR